MKKEQLFGRVEGRYQEFLDGFQGLGEEAIFEPGVVGDWSVRDLMAHITTWEEEALQALPQIYQGKRLPTYASKYGSVDDFNAQKHEQKKGLSLEQVREQMEETHRRFMAYLDGVSTEAYAKDGRFLRRVRLDTYGHYIEHTKHIREWRRAKSL